MSLRIFARNLRRRDGAPDGTTHVLAHLPASSPDTPDGRWELQPLGSWQAGTPLDSQPHHAAAADVYAGYLYLFAEASLGYPVSLTRLQAPCPAGPAYYVTPAGGGR